jgi:hypothetical protein
MQDLQEQTDHWINKYETDRESFNIDLQVTRERIEKLKKENDELTELYEQRKNEIERFLENKKKRDEADALNQKRNFCATVIQVFL